MNLLATRAQRAFAVLLCVVVTAGFTAAIFTFRASPPTDTYFFTTDGKTVDIRSPTRTLIIDWDFYSHVVPFDNAARERFRARCNWTDKPKPPSPIGAEYREVTLCNANDSTGPEFDVRHEYFKSRVDELYSAYYSSLVAHFAAYIGLGLAICGTVFAAWSIGRWIFRGA